MKYRIRIVYCPQCNWLLRSAWMAQEILSSFTDSVAEVALVPSKTAGAFEILVEDEVIWERKLEGGFPDVKALKQRVRDAVEPGRDLGHIDR